MAKKIILGIEITNRVKNVPEVQSVLTEYGCHIKTRLGIHDVDDESCSPAGLLVLETFGSTKGIAAFERKLKGIKGVKVQKMVF